MDRGTNTQSDFQLEDQASAPEEMVQDFAVQVGRLIEAHNISEALARFRQLHRVDQGETLTNLTDSLQLPVLDGLSPAETADILEEMDPEAAAGIFQELDTAKLAKILDQARPDAAADLLRFFPAEARETTIQEMTTANDVAPLLLYRTDSAGRLMTLGYPVVRETSTTPNALDQLRLLGAEADNINSILVVDDEQHLVGSLSIARLALARPTSRVGDLADRDIITVTAEHDQEECARLMERYNLSQLPVVDDEGQLTGVILAQDIVDVVEEEATEDMYRMAGVAGERVMGPLGNSLRRRLPWLYLNLATVMLAALMISIFESTIASVAALAVFLPVVAGQGGIGGTQTVTLVVRSMALGEVPRHLGFRLLAREVSLGLINGGLLGVVVGLVAYAWKGSGTLGIVLGVAMLGNMLVAGLAGAGVPLLLRRLRMDPAVSSSVFVTTFTDVIGFVLFLGLAAVLFDF